jgi:hypothetical protein
VVINTEQRFMPNIEFRTQSPAATEVYSAKVTTSAPFAGCFPPDAGERKALVLNQQA